MGFREVVENPNMTGEIDTGTRDGAGAALARILGNGIERKVALYGETPIFFTFATPIL